MEIDLSNLDRDQKKKYRTEIRILKKNRIFRKEYRKLKQDRQIKIEVFASSGKDSGFMGLLSGDGVLKSNPAGRMDINFSTEMKEYSSEDLELLEAIGAKPDNATLNDDVLEEVIHAMQYFELIKSNNGSIDISDIEIQGWMNREFEAKSIRGIIKNELGLPQATREDNQVAEASGVKYANQGNTNGYFDDLNKWSRIPSNPYSGSKNKISPKLLQRIIAPKKSK